jgi:hypothetical protein
MPCMELTLAIGIGIGLASIAGIRAFLPLALAALFALFGLFWSLPQVISVGEWAFVGGLAALAVLEIVLDRVSALERAFNIVMIPVRAAAGAVLFNAAFGLDLEAGSWLIAGGLIAGAVAVLKLVLRPSQRVSSTGVSVSFLSLFEDVVALVGGAVALFVPYLSALFVAFLLFFYYRIRKRRGRKYGGLRILGD